MGDYMKEALRPTGTTTLDELLKDKDFIVYCERFHSDIMVNFKEKVESYICYKIKESRNNSRHEN